MPSLFLHSLTSFDPIIEGVLDRVAARRIVEVGSEGAIFSAWLGEYAARHDGHVRCVDPVPSDALRDLVASTPTIELLERYSPAVLEDVQDADTYVLDGDHNWSTVISELRGLRARLTDAERPAVVLMHDVHWPWARRDLYYDPEQVDPAERQPFSFKGGVAPGVEGIDPHGFRGAGGFAIAEREGGPRNGVLTAVDDFLEETPGLTFRLVPCVFGLGILHSASAPWAAELDRFLAPYDRSPLLERLEANRIDLYLQVLRLQDEIDRRTAVQGNVVSGLRRRVAELEAAQAAVTAR
jgi:hypothetical protein